MTLFRKKETINSTIDDETGIIDVNEEDIRDVAPDSDNDEDEEYEYEYEYEEEDDEGDISDSEDDEEMMEQDKEFSAAEEPEPVAGAGGDAKEDHKPTRKVLVVNRAPKLKKALAETEKAGNEGGDSKTEGTSACPSHDSLDYGSSFGYSQDTTIIADDVIIEGKVSTQKDIIIRGVINGNVESKGNVSVYGTINGDVTAESLSAENCRIDGDIKASSETRIMNGAVIVGEIHASDCYVCGSIRGNLDISGRVEIKDSAVIQGDILGDNVDIEGGAVVDGRCVKRQPSVDFDSIFVKSKTKSKKTNEETAVSEEELNYLI